VSDTTDSAMRSLLPALRHRTLLSVLLVAITALVITVIAVTLQRADEAPEPETVGPPVFVSGGTPSL
jgi:hypothetical protein